jgi:hypothetical protein
MLRSAALRKLTVARSAGARGSVRTTARAAPRGRVSISSIAVVSPSMVHVTAICAGASPADSPCLRALPPPRPPPRPRPLPDPRPRPRPVVKAAADAETPVNRAREAPMPPPYLPSSPPARSARPCRRAPSPSPSHVVRVRIASSAVIVSREPKFELVRRSRWTLEVAGNRDPVRCLL